MPEHADDATRTCPWCAETIKQAAVICRYCGRGIDGDVRPESATAPATPTRPPPRPPTPLIQPPSAYRPAPRPVGAPGSSPLLPPPQPQVNVVIVILMACFCLVGLPIYLSAIGFMRWRWTALIFGALFALMVIFAAADNGTYSSTPSSSPDVVERDDAPDEPDLYISRKDLERSIKDDSSYQLTGEEFNVQSATCTMQDTRGAKWSCRIRALGESTSTPYFVEVNKDGEWASSVDTEQLQRDAEATVVP